MSDQRFAGRKIAILPNLRGFGGPSSFNTMFTSRLAGRQVTLSQDTAGTDLDAILVIGGTSKLLPLWQARRRGVRVVQRLNGMNWIHKRVKSSVKYYLRSELNNRLLAFIRREIADAIIYQSNFSKDWWHTEHGQMKKPHTVIYNGVDLERFSDQGPEQAPDDRIVIQLLEARISGGYEAGLTNAIALAEGIQRVQNKPVELRVTGKISEALKAATEQSARVKINWTGVLPHSEIPALHRSAHLLFSADLNAACPNSVLEALACGLPVVAYATGALPELVTDGAGAIAPYGSNYWKLEPPNPTLLIEKSLEVLKNLREHKLAARRKAVEAFGADQITDSYLDYLLTN